ncbi:MFS transporter [Nocardia sp. alder85J]|uniref:MFS transporter n=1 Tax=Nocardia sp. alder85J TaxID=2862949 RepID=UPI0022590EBC|nr:MFS transporter [Nocardia sp. alder85J]MCX4097321.1 MFS transporter [Nocardia sp. alder85J]
MDTSTVAPATRFARAAVFTVFCLNGFTMSMWVVHIPAITARTGVSHATLGMLILLMAGGGILGMQAAGPVADRVGSRTMVAAAGVFVSFVVLGPINATGPASLAIALAALGFGNGALDVSMNSQAVQVERRYGRPIMSAFHALFSCGGLVGSLAGSAALHAGLDPRVTVTFAAALGLVLITGCIPRLLPPDRRQATDAARPEADTAATTVAESATDLGNAYDLRAASGAMPDRDGVPDHGTDHDAVHSRVRRGRVHDTEWGATASGSGVSADGAGDGVPGRRRDVRRVVALGAIAFAFLMTEGVANDWSALQVHERLHVADATAALAFGAFSTTMTIGRFAADRINGQFGRVALVRWGALLAAAGLALIVGSAWVPVTLAGWALLGVGLAGGVPQIFSAAGNLGTETATTDMSHVFTLGYLGFLVGPSAIGWLAKFTSLTAALIFPLVTILLCAWFACMVATPA